MASELSWETDKAILLEVALNDSVEVRRGHASVFIPLGENIGVKLFPTAEWRDFATAKQAIAARHGLGPAVGDDFEVNPELRHHPILVWEDPQDASQLRYGYVTRRADQTRSPTTTEMVELIKRLVAVPELNAPPIEDFEDNPANYGYIDDRIVFVDFDEGTWTVP